MSEKSIVTIGGQSFDVDGPINTTIYSDIAKHLAIPNPLMNVDPPKTAHTLTASIEMTMSFYDEDLFNRAMEYLTARSFWRAKFGKLPCGKSHRSRMVKKRQKKILTWYRALDAFIINIDSPGGYVKGTDEERQE